MATSLVLNQPHSFSFLSGTYLNFIILITQLNLTFGTHLELNYFVNQGIQDLNRSDYILRKFLNTVKMPKIKSEQKKGLLKEGRRSCKAKWYVGTCSGDLT